MKTKKLLIVLFSSLTVIVSAQELQFSGSYDVTGSTIVNANTNEHQSDIELLLTDYNTLKLSESVIAGIPVPPIEMLVAIDGDGNITSTAAAHLTVSVDAPGLGTVNMPLVANLIQGNLGNDGCILNIRLSIVNEAFTVKIMGIFDMPIAAGNGANLIADYSGNKVFFAENADGYTLKYTAINGQEAKLVAPVDEIVGALNIPGVVSDGSNSYEVTEIGNRAFDFPNFPVDSISTEITSVSIPNTVIVIGAEAFNHSLNLKKVTIGSGVDSIGMRTFSYSGLDTLIFLGVNPPRFFDTEIWNWKTWGNPDAVVLVPCESVDAYRAVPSLDYFNSITCEEDVVTRTPAVDASVEVSVTGYYNTLGQKLLKEPESGIYIILYNNGQSKKTLRQ
ncbi:MAG: leucine-rich repeat domain-containing protein [Prevotellaceae bacterium]|jgi:hypothetical protein|nr:leucine-rich repeat domain-containing protein [Prevotellaceae bacterium]